MIAVVAALILLWAWLPPAHIVHSTYLRSQKILPNERGVVVQNKTDIEEELKKCGAVAVPTWVSEARLNKGEMLIFFPNNTIRRVVPIHFGLFAIAVEPSENPGVGVALLRGGDGTMVFKREVSRKDQKIDTIAEILCGIVYVGLATWWCARGKNCKKREVDLDRTHG